MLLSGMPISRLLTHPSHPSHPTIYLLQPTTVEHSGRAGGVARHHTRDSASVPSPGPADAAGDLHCHVGHAYAVDGEGTGGVQSPYPGVCSTGGPSLVEFAPTTNSPLVSFNNVLCRRPRGGQWHLKSKHSRPVLPRFLLHWSFYQVECKPKKC